MLPENGNGNGGCILFHTSCVWLHLCVSRSVLAAVSLWVALRNTGFSETALEVPLLSIFPLFLKGLERVVCTLTRNVH